jgi:hypothetical protein
MIYTSKCNNLNILRYDVLFILRLINMFYPEPAARSAVRGYQFPPAIYTRGNESISEV